MAELRAFNPDTFSDTGKQRLAKMVDVAKRENFTDVPLLLSIANVETGHVNFDPAAVSPTGPVGTFQLTKLIGDAYVPGGAGNRTDFEKNTTGAVRFLKELQRKYGPENRIDIATAFNQGETVTNKFRRGEIALPAEGQRYRAAIPKAIPIAEAYLASSFGAGQRIQTVSDQARRGANISPADAQAVISTPGRGGLFAQKNRLHEIPYSEQQRITKQFLGRVKAALGAVDKSAAAAFEDSFLNEVNAFREANAKDPTLLVQKAFNAFAEEENFYTQSEARQKLLAAKFKADEISNIASRYPPGQGLSSRLKANFDLFVADERERIRTSPEAVAGRQERLDTAIAAAPVSPTRDIALNFFTGLEQGFSSAPRAIEQLFKSEAAGTVADWIDGIFPEPSEKSQESFTSTLAQGAGFLASLVAGGAVGAGAKAFGIGGKALTAAQAVNTADKGKALGIISGIGRRLGQNKVATAMAGSAGAVDQMSRYYAEQEKKGIETTPARRTVGALVGSVIGASDTLLGGVSKFFPSPGKGFTLAGKINGAVASYFKKKPRLAAALATGKIEATQELLQGAAAEIAGKVIAGEDKDFWEAAAQVAEEGGAGGILGGALGLLFPGRIRPPGVFVENTDPAKVVEEKEKIIRQSETVTPLDVEEPVTPPTPAQPTPVRPPPAVQPIPVTPAEDIPPVQPSFADKSKQLFKKKFTPFGLLGADVGRAFESLTGAYNVSNIGIASDITEANRELLKRGASVKTLPEADLQNAFDLMQGVPDADQNISGRVRNVLTGLAGNLQTERQRVMDTFVAPVQSEFFNRMYPGLQSIFSDPDLDTSSIEAIRSTYLEKITPILTAEGEAQGLTKEDIQATINANMSELSALIRNQQSLITRYINFQGLSDTIRRGVTGRFDTEEPTPAYTHRTYEMFTNPDFRKRRREDSVQREEMARYIGQQLKLQRAEDTLQRPGETDTEYETRITGVGRRVVDEWLGDAPINYTLTSETNNINALLKRTLQDPKIAAYLGEIKNPFAVYASTMDQLTTLSANAEFAQNVLDLGRENRFLFTEDPGDGRYQQLTLKDRQGFDALQGVYVPTELRDGLEEAFKQIRPGDIMKLYNKANYMAKWGLTVGSPPTGIRNFTFNIFGGLANGAFHPAEFGRAIKALWPTTVTRKKAINAELKDAIKRGVVGESITAGQVNKTVEELVGFDEINEALTRTGVSSKQAGPLNTIKKSADFLRRMYVFGDDVGKLMAYSVEKNRRAEARGLDPDDPEIQKEAAEITKQTWPTYRRAYPIAQDLRKAPVSAFPTFILEIVRTSQNIARQIQKDLNDPNPEIRKIGVKRMAGSMALLAMTPMLVNGAAKALGMDDEEHERACQTSLTPWQECSTTIFTARTKDGYRGIDMRFFNPYLYLTAPISALMDDKNADLGEALSKSIGELAEPFVSPDVLINAWREADTNKGGKVYRDTDVPAVKTAKQTAYIAKKIAPKILKIPGEYYNSLKGVRDRQGRARPTRDVTLRNLGWSDGPMYPMDSVMWGAYNYNKIRNAESGRIKDVLLGKNRTNPTTDIQAISDTINESNVRLEEAWVELQKTVSAIQQLPHEFSADVVERNLRGDKAAGLGKAGAKLLLDGAPSPRLSITKGTVADYIKKLRASTPQRSEAEIQAIEAQLKEIVGLFPASR